MKAVLLILVAVLMQECANAKETVIIAPSASLKIDWMESGALFRIAYDYMGTAPGEFDRKFQVAADSSYCEGRVKWVETAGILETRLSWDEFAKCSASTSTKETIEGVIGRYYYDVHRLRDGTVIACSSAQSQRFQARGIHRDALANSLSFETFTGTSDVAVRGYENAKGVRVDAGAANNLWRTSWSLPSWKIEPGGSAVVELYEARTNSSILGFIVCHLAELPKSASQKIGNKPLKEAKASEVIASVKNGKPLQIKDKRAALLHDTKARRKDSVLMVKIDSDGCVDLPLPDGKSYAESEWLISVSKADVCVQNEIQAACESAYPPKNRTSSGFKQIPSGSPHICIADITGIFIRVRDTHPHLKASLARHKTRLQVQYEYAVRAKHPAPNRKPINNLEALAPVGVLPATSLKDHSIAALSAVLAKTNCSVSDCISDGDGNEFVIVTPVSNWVLITVIVISGLLILLLIFFIYYSAFRSDDARRQRAVRRE